MKKYENNTINIQIRIADHSPESFEAQGVSAFMIDENGDNYNVSSIQALLALVTQVQELVYQLSQEEAVEKTVIDTETGETINTVREFLNPKSSKS